MRITVVAVPDCPHAVAAAERVHAALQRLGRADVQMDSVLMTTAVEAAQLGAPGSPTILVDGRDLFPSRGAAAGGGLVCRLYATPSGLAGVPTVEQVADALSALED